MSFGELNFDPADLLADHPYQEPLIVRGVRCHGGFDDSGSYVPPRTRNRVPAIKAWQQRYAREFSAPLLDQALDATPPHYPNVEQAKHLIRNGVREPMIQTLTRIGTVEGFGAGIRFGAIEDMQQHFVEDLTGTATAHLVRGLYEAHARDEAGFEDEAGHKQMWWAARDIAFENPPVEDATDRIRAAMGIPPEAKTPEERVRRMQEMAQLDRIWPRDVDAMLEAQVTRMVRLMLIEISAFHGFSWAETVLSDTSLVRGDGDAARIISYVRTDETPHVEYLKCSLSEMRERTIRTVSGSTYPARDLIMATWNRTVAGLAMRSAMGWLSELTEIERALNGNPRREEILDKFHSLGDVRPGPNGTWIEQTPQFVIH